MGLQKLGPFELLRVIGRGGMGMVYEARESGCQERVAVKALSPVLSFDDHFRNRFEAEIDALMLLDHPNIVRLLSYGQDEGNLFFAMELVDGTSLYQEQKQGYAFHWREIIDIAIQVCEGLRHAHDRGIVHRDLKPGNLMMDAQRKVKITDFGIAKTFGRSELTNDGNVLGTMDFMAPEQARGQNATARSDLFSLGTVMYSLLAGRPPFLRDSVEATFDALLSNDPPPRLDKVAPDIPKPLAALIHRLMEKDPTQRIATALATGRQLVHVRDQVKRVPTGDTQVVGAEHDLLETANTRVVADHATGDREFGETAERRDHRLPTNVSPDSVPVSRVAPAAGETRPEPLDFPGRQPNYYNEVTAQQRKKKSELISERPESGRVWPLVLALGAVVTLFAVGLWIASRQPTRAELLSIIMDNEFNLSRVQQELKLYQQLYYDDSSEEQKAYIGGLVDRVDVIKYANELSKRQKPSAKRPLTQIESKFLENYDKAQEDVPEALSRMRSFRQIYAGREDLSVLDTQAMLMAQRFTKRWQKIADLKIQQGRQFINDALTTARRMGNKSEATKLIQWVIESYSQDPWAEDLIKEAKRELADLETTEPDTEGEPESDRAPNPGSQPDALSPALPDSQSESDSGDRGAGRQ